MFIEMVKKNRNDKRKVYSYYFLVLYKNKEVFCDVKGRVKIFF